MICNGEKTPFEKKEQCFGLPDRNQDSGPGSDCYDSVKLGQTVKTNRLLRLSARNTGGVRCGQRIERCQQRLRNHCTPTSHVEGKRCSSGGGQLVQDERPTKKRVRSPCLDENRGRFG